ncbi:MAG: hypothetical protein HUK40_12855 [Desulfobacter sp.]|nr:hypothetical protein [Desulfobacter sp.]WDP83834.1 MAG: hypothetical protein HUN05_00500 [Desulfobacter sp.]
MKKIILTFVCILGLFVSLLQADEIVLETGKILSGNILALEENTVSILVKDKTLEINRAEIEAVFLGAQSPFSAHGYPGLAVASPDVKPGADKDENTK